MLRKTTIALSAFLFSLSTASSAIAEEYNFSAVPQFDQKKMFSIWSPIISKLEAKTGLKINLVSTDSIEAFGARVTRGDFDIAYVNPYLAVLASDSHGYVAIMNSASEKLSGIVVVNKNSPIQNISDLNDKTIAFPSKSAFAATLMVRADLEGKHNIKFKPDYVKNHNSVYLNVAKNFADAGGGVDRTLAQQPQEIKDNLRIIYTTATVPSHPIVAHPRVGEENIEKIKTALFEIYKEDKSLFDSIPMRDPKEVSMKEYDLVKSLKLDKIDK